MQIKIGAKIKELRKRDKLTQEEIAQRLGVTSQAVSRWEADAGYPDMEMIPSIAGLFGISIDALFGYDNVERKNRIDKIISEFQNMEKQETPLSEQVVFLRNAAAEFPGEDRILYMLAGAISAQGSQEYGFKAADGGEYVVSNTEYNKSNPFIQESINIYTNLISNSKNNLIVNQSKYALVFLYKFLGMTDKTIEIAETFSEINSSKEILLYHGANGKDACKYAQDALMKLLFELKNAILAVMSSRRPQNPSDIEKEIEKINGIIKLYELIYDDGNMGLDHGSVSTVYDYLASSYCRAYEQNRNESRYLDLAFGSLDKELEHAMAFDKLIETASEHKYTAFLVNLMAIDINTLHFSGAPITKHMINLGNRFSRIKKVLERDERWQAFIDKVNKINEIIK